MQKAAIIGLGSWGQRLVRAVQGKSESLQFARAVTRTPARVEAFAREHDLAVSDRLRDALDDPAIDLVVIASPAAQHGPQGLAALNAGKPTMIIKPLALGLRQARMLLAESEKLGVPLVLGYNRGFFPSTIELKRRIAAGDLGVLVHAEGSFCTDRFLHLLEGDWKADPTQSLPGSLADHMLYDMINVCGPVAEVHAMAAHRIVSNGLLDTTAVVLQFREGITGLLSAVGATPDYHRLAFFGEKGWGEVRRPDSLSLKAAGEEMAEISFDRIDCERAQLEAFAQAIHRHGHYPVSLPESVHAVQVLEAMALSASEGRAVSIT